LKISFKLKNYVFTSKPLELFHTNLFDLIKTLRLGGKQYNIVIVDEY